MLYVAIRREWSVRVGMKVLCDVTKGWDPKLDSMCFARVGLCKPMDQRENPTVSKCCTTLELLAFYFHIASFKSVSCFVNHFLFQEAGNGIVHPYFALCVNVTLVFWYPLIILTLTATSKAPFSAQIPSYCWFQIPPNTLLTVYHLLMCPKCIFYLFFCCILSQVLCLNLSKFHVGCCWWRPTCAVSPELASSTCVSQNVSFVFVLFFSPFTPLTV